MEVSDGARLASLLMGGFTAMVDEVVEELARRGHPGVTATHEFALQAIDGGARTAADLGRRLGVSKQAAAKTIAALEDLGYVDREDDPLDARRKRLVVTARGADMVRIGAGVLDRIRDRWVDRLGPDSLRALEDALGELTARRA